MAKWFICEQDEVSGPFDTETLKNKISEGTVSAASLIWGHPQEDWRSPSWWSQNLPDLLSSQKQPKDEKLWHYVLNDTSHGPMKRVELIETLVDHEEKASILIWTNGMPDWMPLFEVTDVMEEIGISRRQHPRAEIKGQVIVTHEDQSYIGQLRSVSAGGCGVTGVTEISPGNNVHITLKADKFYKELRAQAEIRYISSGGYMGLQFTAINSEEKAAIIDYVRSEVAKQEEAA